MCYLHYPADMFINIAKLRLEKYGNFTISDKLPSA